MIIAPLAALASDPATSRGRLHPEQGGHRGPRTAFQRDRDRIIHSVSFRRLRHKTQVFIAPDGDHYRVRLTHSLEVAQIGRTIARALGLNEDLTEALCLAHDIGHPPFGHAGEAVLDRAMAAAGGFDHNAHCLRTLCSLETPYPLFDGLNLSWEMLEGLAKHNGPVDHPNWALAAVDAAAGLDLGGWPSLEAQVAALADDIAYDNHDMDDGLRSGLITLDDLAGSAFVQDTLHAVSSRFPGLPQDRIIPELVRDQIGLMVNDLIAETRAQVATAGVRSVEDVRAAGVRLVRFSPAMEQAERQLKAILMANVYRHPRVLSVTSLATEALDALAGHYLANPSDLPDGWIDAVDNDIARIRRTGDFIAGMTDRYAVARHRELVGPIDLPASV